MVVSMMTSGGWRVIDHQLLYQRVCELHGYHELEIPNTNVVETLNGS